MSWEPLPVPTDDDEVGAGILDGLVGALPGWTPREGALEAALALEVGRTTAGLNRRVQDAYEAAIAALGVSVYGLTPIVGAAATLPVALTVTGAGAVVPAGFTVIGRTDDGLPVAFRLPAAVTATSSTVLASLVAADAGATGNGVPAGSLEAVTATLVVTDAVATAPSTGGVDPETRADYVGRFVDFISTLRPGAVRASDVMILARNTPGVQRALAVDLYDAQTSSAGVAKTVSVYPVDADGEPVPTATKNALRAALEAVREVNFVFRVADPTYTAVDVTFVAGADDGYDPDVVRANIVAALTTYLSPARWGAPRSLPAGVAATTWQASGVVRQPELIRAAGSADGVLYIDQVEINGALNDVTLEGVAALPAPVGTDPDNSTITGTVT